jgi:hypothetical protein
LRRGNALRTADLRELFVPRIKMDQPRDVINPSGTPKDRLCTTMSNSGLVRS